MTGTTSTLTATDDDLRALAAEREAEAAVAVAELERRDAERAEAAAAVQRERDERLVLAAVVLEEGLVEDARQAEAAFSTALAEGDLSAAFGAFVRRKASRPARQGLRDAQRAAERNAQTGAGLLQPEMIAYDTSAFFESVNTEAERLAGERGYAHGQRLCEQAGDGEASA